MRRQLRSHLVLDLVLASGVLGGAARNSAAQDVPPLVQGTRVRLLASITDTRDTQQIEGRLVALRGDTIVIDTSRGTHAVPVATELTPDRQLEVLGSRHPYTTLGAIMGCVTGLAVGGAFSSDGGPGTTIAEGFERELGPPLMGAMLGTVLGAMIGQSIRVDAWTPINMPRTRISVSPQGAGVRVWF